MRFLTLFILLAIFSCKNKPAQKDLTWNEVFPEDPIGPTQSSTDSTNGTYNPYVFTDTVLVSINAVDFAAVMKAKPNMPILDIRSEAQFKTGHIWRANCFDPDAKDFDARISGLSRTQEYAVYCQAGNRSFDVATEMKRLGIHRIYHLQKGLNFWGEAGQALQLK